MRGTSGLVCRLSVGFSPAATNRGVKAHQPRGEPAGINHRQSAAGLRRAPSVRRGDNPQGGPCAVGFYL